MPNNAARRRPRPTERPWTTLADLAPETRAAFTELQREGSKLGVTLTLTADRFVLSGVSGQHTISARPDDSDADRLRGHADGFFGWYRARAKRAAMGEQLSLLAGAAA